MALILPTALPAETPEPGTRLPVPLTLNGIDRGETLAIIQADDILIPVATLERLGLPTDRGTRTIAEGTAYVSLKSLAPLITYKFDQDNVALAVLADPSLLPPTVIKATELRPAGIEYSRDPSAFLNYAATTTGLHQLSFSGEAGVNRGGELLSSTFARRFDGSFERGLTSLTIDDRARLRRTTVGDAFAFTDVLGGNVLLGGAAVSRRFELDPYMYRFPTTEIRGAAEFPSTVEVYANDILIRREEIPPGVFDLTNLHLPTGNGTTRVIIRDVYGNERVIASSYYGSSNLLAPGLAEYDYAVGFKRTDSSHYEDQPVFLGFHRMGITDWLTAGARLEAGRDLLSAGLSGGTRGRIGQFGFAAGASRAGGSAGSAAEADYSFVTQHGLSMAAGMTLHSKRYATSSLGPADDRAMVSAAVAGGMQLGRVSLSAQYNLSDFRDAPRRTTVGVGTSIPVWRGALFINAARSNEESGRTQNSLFAGLTIAIGRHESATLSTDRVSGTSLTSVGVQRSPQLGTGLSYRLQGDLRDGESTGRGLLQYQAPFGIFTVDADTGSGGSNARLTAAGGLMAIGGRLLIARPVQESFAVIRVPGVGGVRGYASNQEIGRTDSRGDLIVPSLLSYYGNVLSIADPDVPLDYEILSTHKTVAPPFRGGALVAFPVVKIQNLQGKLLVVLNGADVVPAEGEIRLVAGGKSFSSPVGEGGEFYLENLPAGTYTATIEFERGTCRLPFVVPSVAKPFINAGTLRCTDIVVAQPAARPTTGLEAAAPPGATPPPAPAAPDRIKLERLRALAALERASAEASQYAVEVTLACSVAEVDRALTSADPHTWLLPMAAADRDCFHILVGHYPTEQAAQETRSRLAADHPEAKVVLVRNLLAGDR